MPECIRMLFILSDVMVCPLGLLHSTTPFFYRLVFIQSIPLVSAFVRVLESCLFIYLFMHLFIYCY